METHAFSWQAAILFSLVFGMAQLLAYALIVGVPYLYFYTGRREHLQVFKIQEREASKIEAMKELKLSLRTIGIWTLFMPAIHALYQLNFFRLYDSVEEWGWVYFIASFFIIQFIHDSYFYWTHRLMHRTRWGWKMHQTHHQFKNPTPLSAFAFHPGEALVHLIFYPIILAIVPVHPFVLFFYHCFQLLVNSDGHLGFEFWPTGLHRHPLYWVLNTSTHHNMHHSSNRGNYGLYYNVWDTLCQTNHKDYERVYNAIKARRVMIPANKKLSPLAVIRGSRGGMP
jgi:sterol desaturase/sphingolipid hydroxylase (fatty acid hydroxylase superfamily)